MLHGHAGAVRAFIDDLAQVRADMAFNPWGESCTAMSDHFGPEGRRERLAAHMDCDARLILIGEAAGYQGARYSGIAFANERLLCEGQIPRIPATPRLTGRPRPWSEPSATIVWRTLYELGVAESTVLWNAYPFHPHGPADELNNRTPSRREAQDGIVWLQRFVSLFPNALVVSVGKVSARVIESAGLDLAGTVRHPANGGARKFADGLKSLLEQH